MKDINIIENCDHFLAVMQAGVVKAATVIS